MQGMTKYRPKGIAPPAVALAVGMVLNTCFVVPGPARAADRTVLCEEFSTMG